MIFVECSTEGQVADLFFACSVYNLETTDAIGAVALRIGGSAILWQWLTEGIDIQVIPGVTRNTLSVIVVTLAIVVGGLVSLDGCHVVHGTGSIDWVSIVVSKPPVTLNTVSLHAPPPAVRDHNDTDVFPFPESLVTLDASTVGFVPVFALLVPSPVAINIIPAALELSDFLGGTEDDEKGQ